MSTDLQEFFSLIGKAKKEKEDEFNELVGDLRFVSLFTEVASLKKENQEKKDKEKRQAAALESWLYASPQTEETVEETEDDQEEYEISEETTTDEEELEENISEENKSDDDDTIDHALQVLEELKSKEEVQENLGDPEILKIRRELEYLKNLVNAQGGGGETRLRYLDDIVGIATNLSAYDGMYLGIDTSNSAQPFVFSSVSGGGGATGAGGTWATFDSNTGITTTKKVKIDDDLEVTGVTTSTGGFVGTLTGSASSLSGVSSSFLLDYDNFTNTPTIPTNNNQLTNGAGYITTSFTNTNQLTNGAGFITTSFTNTNQLDNGAGFITASDNITGTAAGLSGTPDITVQNITGVAATFTGNVSVAGTLTYEDVTSIDSVGIVTARSGVQIGGPAVIAIETATSTKTSTSQASVDSFTAATYRSAQFQVQVTRGSAYHMTTINVIHDGTSAYMTEFGTVKTGTSLATFDADINSGSVRLLATPSSATSTVFKISKTLTTV